MCACIRLLAHVQNIEDAIKDLTLWKIQNRDEITRSFIASMHSFFAPSTKETLQEYENFINQKRSNEDAQWFYGDKLFTKNLLIQISSIFPTGTNKEEHDHWCNIIGKANHIKELREFDMAHAATSSAPKADDATARKTGVCFAPLLEGNI